VISLANGWELPRFRVQTQGRNGSGSSAVGRTGSRCMQSRSLDEDKDENGVGPVRMQREGGGCARRSCRACQLPIDVFSQVGQKSLFFSRVDDAPKTCLWSSGVQWFNGCRHADSRRMGACNGNRRQDLRRNRIRLVLAKDKLDCRVQTFHLKSTSKFQIQRQTIHPALESLSCPQRAKPENSNLAPKRAKLAKKKTFVQTVKCLCQAIKSSPPRD
jgi:hypothetical protein